jgi:hypothetical protein
MRDCWAGADGDAAELELAEGDGEGFGLAAQPKDLAVGHAAGEVVDGDPTHGADPRNGAAAEAAEPGNTGWPMALSLREPSLPAMAVISLKLTEDLDAQLSEQAQRRRLSKSELVRRALTAFLQAPDAPMAAQPMPASAADLVADLVGCCEGAPSDLSSNPAHLRGFGEG